MEFSHIDHEGKVRMVDVGAKPETERTAVAEGEVLMRPETLEAIRQGTLKKGDLLTVAQIAGVMAAKKTAELIPLCHPLNLTHIQVDLVFDDKIPGIRVRATTRVYGKTGVEMEALTAVTVAALTIYDMAKAIEKTMRIQNIRLIEKYGGMSGDVKNE
jgi:cyclic pyranopterin phosphate synthase